MLEGGRIAMAAMAVGLAQGALDQAVRYAKERHAFGQPIGQFQGIQAMLADLATEVEAARLLTLRAAYGKDQGRPVMREASMAKVFSVRGRGALRDQRRSRFTADTATRGSSR